MAAPALPVALPSSSAFALAFLCFCFALLLPQTVATDHIVGANRGWQLPSAVPGLNYSNWSASHTFRINDEITFNYQRGLYTVFELNYSTYVNCSFNIWYGKDWIYNWTNRGGKTKLVLNETKIYYFACGLDNHCQQGMKVAVNVTDEPENLSLQSSGAKKGDADSSHTAPRTPSLSICALALISQFLLLVAPWLPYPLTL